MILSVFVKNTIDFGHTQIWLWVFLLKENLTLDVSICPNMTLSMFVKGKVDFRHIQIWLWVCLSKEKLTLNMSKYDFEYVYQMKSWLRTWPNMTLSTFIKGKVNFRHVQICPNMTLSIFVKGKVDFRHIEIWLWVCLWKEKLTLDTSKYDFEYVCQKKSWL
jgi:predicted nucleic acid-binding Zn finger protein